MGSLSKGLIVVSLLQLFHAGFSSSEFQQLLKTQQLHKYLNEAGLPLDIKLEVFMGLIIFVIGIFLSFEKLQFQPIELTRPTVITGEYLSDIRYRKATNVENLTGSNLEGQIIYTSNLTDVHQKRKECRDWMNENTAK
ncbi:hypothetical protein TPHA_0C01400 [Tetrapisispora phaffii CBS 4417]|uniref:ER membrane protein complex subunit 5 n=1 Tax=Tetrapisispora phaffii (strain ATCC 24235 / CBS 4417 / NBRC 1672 / NRRL Y-8282 / UCD 70-5) TaxID=1071381 RepID=G8BRC0_TETPH|nr:hypothetical protein TPHA_0C01400 [Tetrapisispora phaffii CBS 4417]CCE62296.1 hypothetical protein TPHA_0C01400 [Tetrapisispora phaffii CBS 4417]